MLLGEVGTRYAVAHACFVASVCIVYGSMGPLSRFIAPVEQTNGQCGRVREV